MSMMEIRMVVVAVNDGPSGGEVRGVSLKEREYHSAHNYTCPQQT